MTKKEFRIDAKRFASGLRKQGTYAIDKRFERTLLYFLSQCHFSRILLFLPMKIEPRVENVIKKLRQAKKQVYVPLIEDISFKIVKYRLPLRDGKYTILTCDNSFELIKKIDIAIVPVLGIDVTFARIGFGKGMYDRFFSHIHPRPMIVFVQRALCFCPERISEAHDIKGDFAVVPDKIYTRGSTYYANNDIYGHRGFGYRRGHRLFSRKKNRFRTIPNIRRTVKIKSESD